MTATHHCPGGCGAQIPNARYACPEDWFRLPAELRRVITRTARQRMTSERFKALQAAAEWYASNSAADGRGQP